MQTIPLEEKLNELKLFFRAESKTIFRYLDQRLHYFAEQLLLNRLVNYCTKKLLQSFYREILEVNTLIALPEFRFEIPLETSLEASLAADSSQVKSINSLLDKSFIAKLYQPLMLLFQHL